MALSSFDIDAPRWDQSTFMGRLKHFFNITDCRTAVLPDSRLDEAKALVESCRAGSTPPGTSVEQLYYAKNFNLNKHPIRHANGSSLTLILVVEAVLTAFVLFLRQIGVAYVTATSTALATAVGLNLYTKKAPPLVARWVPFAAVAAANCVNIPMMRQQEILNGIAVTDENGNKLGHSKKAAVKGITQVVISRITMAAPGMIILPIIMQRLEKYKFMQRITFLHGPIQVMLVGVFLIFMVPAACSLFPQRCSMAVSKLEPELRDSIVSQYGDKVQLVYFNKGL
ncbi:sideroflexin-2 [Poecilia formosa]|uniref:sideroflexin-2 n=1 Tax=Poecilia formosa TaxID=48698 RepID=UPI0007B9EE8B|nr:PREDICTED: sideroflexin-2 [Poecilia formosa]